MLFNSTTLAKITNMKMFKQIEGGIVNAKKIAKIIFYIVDSCACLW